MSKIQARLVIEIMGRPPEHVKEALTNLVMRLSTEKGVKIVEKTIHDPIPVENSKDLFTTFAEILVDLESIDNYFSVAFGYMPAHIELISPENINLNNNQLNDLANSILQRLHNYDAIAKKITMDRDIILKKLYEVAPHLFKKNEPVQAQQAQPVVSEIKENKKEKSKKKNKSKKK